MVTVVFNRLIDVSMGSVFVRWQDRDDKIIPDNLSYANGLSVLHPSDGSTLYKHANQLALENMGGQYE